MKKLLTLLICTLLMSCDPQPSIVITKTTMLDFEVIYIDPPKRFKVDLRDTQSGYIFENVGRSKRCHHWDDHGRPVVGSIIRVQVTEFYYVTDPAKMTYYKLNDRYINSLFCD